MVDGKRTTRVSLEALTRRQLLVGGAIIGIASCSSQHNPKSGSTAAGSSGINPTPQTGGTLRVGIIGSTNDIVDGQYITAKPDIARLVMGWESLATYDDEFNVTFDQGLAEGVESKAPDHYVIRVRDGVEFHNGKTLSADDVVYSFRRAIDAKLGINPALAELLAPSGITKLDRRTVQIQLTRGAVTFLDTLALYAFGMVPDGYSRDDKEQVGTGPFKMVGFEPGSESVHVKHPNYWQSDKPYLDGVNIVDFADSTALINALLAGQIDCVCDVPYSQVGSVTPNADIEILESTGGTWSPITMAIDQAPFDDARVRRAFRLIVDRDEMVERVLSGYGRVANDMYAPLDPCYASEFPQRVQDLDRAAALLREAGKEGLEVDLFAPDDVPGLADMAAVFAEQAKKIGVTVDVHVLPSSAYWNEEYCKRTFATGFWGTRSYLNQVALSSLHDAVYPETHWPPAGSDFADLYLQALGTTDSGARREILGAMQKQEYDDGGNIIAFFSNLIDAYRSSVHGFVARPNVLNLDHFGHGFKNIWVDG
jgi:peptide/nickel transport system substrate-binding protein